MSASSPSPAGEHAVRADALVMSALLQASVRILGPWSLGLALVSMLFMLLSGSGEPMGALLGAGVLLLGMVERYLAFRLALDIRLFAALASGDLAGVAALDAALVHVGLRRAPAAPRAWGDRLRGTRWLVKCHALIAVSQTLLFLSYFCLLGVL